MTCESRERGREEREAVKRKYNYCRESELTSDPIKRLGQIRKELEGIFDRLYGDGLMGYDSTLIARGIDADLQVVAGSVINEAAKRRVAKELKV